MNKLRFQLALFIAVRLVLNTSLRMVYPFLPALARGLGVDLAHMSIALTLRQATGLAGPLAASLADQHGRKAGMLLGLLLFSLSLAALVIWPVYPVFVAALCGSMLGNLVFVPAMQAYLGEQVPYAQRGRALALTEMSWSLSFILGVPLAGLLLARSGLRLPYIGLAVLGGLAWLALARLLPRTALPPAPSGGMSASFRSVLSSGPALAGMLMGFCINAAKELINVTFGAWMENSFGLQIAALGAAAAIIGVSELGAEGLVALFTDRLGKRLAVAGGLILNTLAALALPWLGGAGPVFALSGLAVFFLSFEFALVSAIPLMTEVHPRARATFISFWIASLAVGRSGGAIAASFLYAQPTPGSGPAGILGVVIAAAGLNGIALLALRRLHASNS